MTNQIPPLNIVTQPPTLADVVVKGEIRNLLPEGITLKQGDNLLLQIMMNDQGSFSVVLNDPKTGQNLSPAQPQSQPLPQPNVAQPASSAQPPLLVLDKPLSLPANQALPVVAKVTAAHGQSLQIKLISINDLPVEKFLPKPNLTTLDITPKTLASNPPQIKDSQPAQSAQPVAVADNPMPHKSIALPQQLFKPAPHLLARLETLMPHAQPTSNQAPVPGSQINIDLSLITDPKAQILPANTSELAQIINTTAPEQLISVLKGVVIKGEVVSPPDQPLAIRTPLGETLIDKGIKLPQKAEVMLVIKDINLPNIPQSRADSLLDILKPLLSKRPAEAHTAYASTPAALSQAKNAVANATLYEQIIQKLPAPDQKMISNMITFMKAAEHKDLSMWLGKDLVQTLSTRGAEGQEVLTRLENFISSSVREPNLAWRIIEVPFFTGQSFNNILISIKQNSEDPGSTGKKKKQGTRFLVDTSFSQLGMFQFDGFAVEQERRFDLIICTSSAPTPDLYAHILNIFKTTLQDLEYSGNLKVNVKENFIKIMDNHEQTGLKKGIYI